MEALSPASPQALKDLARRSGMAITVIFVNAELIVYILSFILRPAILFFDSGKGGASGHTDAGFAALMVLNTIASYAALITAYGFIFRKELGEFRQNKGLFLGERKYRRYFADCVVIFLAGWAAATLGSYVTAFLSDSLHDLFGVPGTRPAFHSLMPENLVQYGVFLFFTCVVAPVCEELIYRHQLLIPMRKYGDLAAALISSLIFALAHKNFDQFLYAFMFGFFLAVLAIRSDSVIPSLIFHIINNFVTTLAAYMPEALKNTEPFQTLSQTTTEVTNLISLAAVSALVIAVITKVFRFGKCDTVTVREQFRLLFTDPLVIASSVTILVITFIDLYR